ncbi:MAG: PH domain-containing protein [Terriglobia bacterium]
MEFRAPYDGLATGITIAVLGLFLGGAGVVVSQPALPPALRYGLAALFLLIPLVTYSYAPTGYRVGPEGVRIQRGWGSVLIPRERLRGGRRAEGLELWGIRTFGSGGLFGFFGWFYSRRFGHYRAYVTHRHKLVVVEAERVYLLSPDRPDEFLRQLSEWLPALRAAERD